MRFFLGTHKISQPWWDLGIPLFISRRVLTLKKHLPHATAPWALDSGGFTELSHPPHRWVTTMPEYIADVRRFQQIGHLDWVAPMDWMCEPWIIEKTGLTVYHHQENTVANFVELRAELGELVIPVLQGWTLDDYFACWDEYAEQGVDLERERLVGLGSVCRRQSTSEIGAIVRALSPLPLHGFGVKSSGLESYADALTSADSMSWSYQARRDHPLRGCTHKSCQNCIRYAARWQQNISDGLSQLRIEVA